MPNWKKVIVSGSDATLNSLYAANSVTASIFSGSFTGSLEGTASWANNVISASYAITASYALNGGSGGSGGGGAVTYHQTTAAVTWSVNHSLNTYTPIVQVYDEDYNQLVPASVSGSSANAVQITFSTATAGYAVITTGGLTITGSNAFLFQSTPATTWSFYHGLNETYPVFTIFDSNDDVIVPLKIHADNANTASIYFSTARTGTAVAANCGLSGSTFESASYAAYAVSASFAQNTATSSYILNAVSASFASNAANATTASFITLAQTASFVQNAQTASYVLNAVSASHAARAISSSYALTASYADNIVVSGSISNVDYIDFDTSSAVPAWKSGRVFWDNTDGCLGVYNAEADVTLQVGQENWTRVRNNTGTAITNGTVVRVIGAQGDVPTVERAQSIAKSGSINVDTQILGVATHTIEDASFGYVTTQGLVRGLNTSAFNDGDSLFVGTGSAGVLQNTAPIAPYEIIPVGVCVKASPGGSGIIYVAVQQPLDFSDLSSVLVTGSYSYGDLWVYRPSGSFGVWEHTKQLSGSYGVTGSVSATSLTGSLQVTGNSTYSGSQTVTTGYVVLTQVSQSLNFADDTSAAAGGVPLGGLYRSGSFILIRLS